ncbi:MAG: IS30 family transposase [Candidatus Levybacteria bacterium]|nr:IS30 family transposase [Candidatus Levybacteria bacterium]
MKKYKHLTLFERETISQFLSRRNNLSDIAKVIGRDKSTICREISRTKLTRYGYRAFTAQVLVLRRQKVTKKPEKIENNEELKEYIHTRLKLRWSPEQIANRLKIEYPTDKNMQVSHEAIYTYLYVLPRGELKKELMSHLRQERTLRRKRGKMHPKRGHIQNMVSIKERPKEVEERTIPGHWEGDLIVGKGRQSALGTLVERTTRTTILIPLKEKDAPSVRKAFAKETKNLPKQMKLSLTYDRGKEMSEHELFTKETKIQVYFADPYALWQRGTNENTNGLIRQYFPKGTDFGTIPHKEIKRVQDLLNGRPRKVLKWKTPFEEFVALAT